MRSKCPVCNPVETVSGVIHGRNCTPELRALVRAALKWREDHVGLECSSCGSLVRAVCRFEKRRAR